MRRGDEALIGNSAYRRYLRATTDQRAFEIDPGKLADEARYDGLFVLPTNGCSATIWMGAGVNQDDALAARRWDDGCW
jgi:hypothetical protein